MAISKDRPYRIRLGRAVYDPAALQLTDADGGQIAMRKMSLKVLGELAAKNGDVISRDDLIQAVWKGRAVSDDSLVQCVKDIRTALKDTDRTLLRTAIGRGYSLHGERDMPTDKGERPKLLIRKLRVATPTERLVELAETITEDLIAAISPRTGLTVTSDDAQKETVHYTIDGRVSLSGSDVRVFLQMIKSRSGDVAFVEKWNVPIADIDDLCGQITARIANILRVYMFNHDGEDVVERDDCDLDMQELLSKAAYHMSRIQMRNCEIARASLSVAIEREPANAMALAMRASTSVLLVLQDGISKIPDAPEYSMELAERAVGLAPHVDFVLLTRGCQRLWLRADHIGARADFDRALDINPTFHLVHQFYAISEILSAEPSSGIARLMGIIERGKTDNPRHPHYLTLLALGELIARNGSAAAQHAREAHERAPQDPWCTYVYAAAMADDHDTTRSGAFKHVVTSNTLPFSHFRDLPFTNIQDVAYLEDRLQRSGYRKTPQT